MRGITPIIAIILLLMIAIAMTGAAFLFLSSSMEDTTNATSTQIQQQTSQISQNFIIDNINGDKVTIRNKGANTIDGNSLKFYANNIDVTPLNLPDIGPGKTAVFTLINIPINSKELKVASSAKTLTQNVEGKLSSSCTLDSECDSSDACTTGTCISGKCSYNSITSCTNSDGCCPSGCNSGNDNDCTGTFCGNNIKEGAEACDGSDLNGQTCQSLGFSSGTLACASSCSYDYSGCIGNPLTESIVANWMFDDASGATAVDSKNTLDGLIYGDTRMLMHLDNMLDETNYHNDGSCTNCPIIETVDCASGGCYNFNGVDNIITIADDASIGITGDISLEAWIKPDPSMSSYGGIISKGSGNGPSFNGYALYSESAGTVNFVIGNNNALNALPPYNGINPGQWNHIVATYEQSSGMMKLYHNGNLIGNQEQYTGNDIGNNGDMTIGYLYWGSTNNFYFNGLIDEVAVYSKVLTPQEVRDHYDVGNGVPKFIEWKLKGTNDYALNFTSNGYVDVAGATLSVKENVTINASIYPNTVSGFHGIIGKWDSDAGRNRGYQLVQENAKLHLYVGDGTTKYDVYTANDVITEKTWQYVSATYNIETGNVKLYVNGQEKITAGTVPPRTDMSKITDPIANNIRIGAYETSGVLSGYFNGMISEAIIINATVTGL